MTSSATLGIGSLSIDNTCMPSIPANYDYERKIEMDMGQERRVDGFIRPTNSLDDSGPYLFNITELSNSFLQMGTLNLYMKAKIVDAEGKNIDVQDNFTTGLNYTTINALGMTMWEEISVSIDGVEIPELGTTKTQYKAFIETILS